MANRRTRWQPRLTACAAVAILSAQTYAVASPPDPFAAKAVAPTDAREVVGRSRVFTTEIVVIGIAGETIEASPEHPFALDGGGWAKAKDITVGTRIRARGAHGVETVTTVDHRHGAPQPVYNLLVSGLHTFHVGGAQLLVHNGGQCVAKVAPLGPGNMVRPIAPNNRQALVAFGRRPMPPSLVLTRGAPLEASSHGVEGDLGKFTEHPDAHNPVGDKWTPLREMDFQKVPDTVSRDLYLHNDPAREISISELGKPIHTDTVDRWAVHMLKNPNTGAEEPWRVISHPDPLVAKEWASVEQYREQMGMAAKNWKLVRNGDRTDWAEQLEPWTGKMPARPQVKMVEGPGSPLAPASATEKRTYELTMVRAPDGVRVTDKIYAGHTGWITETADGKWLRGEVALLGSAKTTAAAGKPSIRGVYNTKEAAQRAFARSYPWMLTRTGRSVQFEATPKEMQENTKNVLNFLRSNEEKPYVLHGLAPAMDTAGWIGSDLSLARTVTDVKRSVANYPPLGFAQLCGRGNNCLDEVDQVLRLANPKGSSALPSVRNPFTMFPNTYYGALGNGRMGTGLGQWSPEFRLPDPNLPTP